MNAAIIFKLTVVSNLCSELVAVDILQYEDGISGQITSPGYPGNYPQNVNYTWIIRTGNPSANVTFRIIEMNITEWNPCDDYLKIEEIKRQNFRLFKRCGHYKNYTILGQGEKFRISFISDKSLTNRGFHLTWRVYLPPTIAMPKTKVTTKKMLATTTKNRIETTSNKKAIEISTLQQKTTTLTSYHVYLPPTIALPKTKVTTKEMLATTTKNRIETTSNKKAIEIITLQRKTTTLTSSHASSTKQAVFTLTSGKTESTTEDKNAYNYISPTAATTPIPDLPSTVENSGRTTSPHMPSELPSSFSIQYSETKRTALQNHSRPLTLSLTTRSSSVELTTLVFNATTQTEDKNTFDIQTVYLITGSVVFEFFFLLVACVSIYRCRNKGRSFQKNQCQQKRDEGARNFANGEYWKSLHVYDTIPVDAVCGLETCQEETNEDIDEQSTLYDKCWRNEHDRAQPAMEKDNRDNAHTYETCERFYFTLQAKHPSTPPATSTPPQRDSTNFYHTVDNSSLPK